MKTLTQGQWRFTVDVLERFSEGWGVNDAILEAAQCKLLVFRATTNSDGAYTLDDRVARRVASAMRPILAKTFSRKKQVAIFSLCEYLES